MPWNIFYVAGYLWALQILKRTHGSDVEHTGGIDSLQNPTPKGFLQDLSQFLIKFC